MSVESPAAKDITAPTRTTGLIGTLFLISVLGLFLELLLIRWMGTEIMIFAYVQNTVLVVCFLGLGIGCLTSRQPVKLSHILMPLTILAALLTLPVIHQGLIRISNLLRLFGARDAVGRAFSTNPVETSLQLVLGLTMMFFLLALAWDVFVPVGRLLARCMDDHPDTIWAYSVNVAGSLVGIWLFVLLSALSQPPFTWFVVVAALMLLLARRGFPLTRTDGVLLVLLLGLAGAAAWEPGALEVCWSPYQKLSVVPPVTDAKDGEAVGKWVVQVNNCGYQTMIDLGREHVAADPKTYPPELAGLSQYDLPALLQPRARKILIVGAGTGNDVAGCLRHDVGTITAVDIDPVIFALGQRYHPEKPYADADRVQRVTDDARAFFAGCTERYDLIVFGLLDAHTTTALSNARLDHYVYTRTSIDKARSLLAPGGVLVLTFEVLQPFIPERMFETLDAVFGHEPIYFYIPRSAYGWGGVMFVNAEDLGPVRARIQDDPRLDRQIAAWKKDFTITRTGLIPLATDDWPYLYLEGPHIPPLFFLVAGLLFLLFLRGWRRINTPGLFRDWGRSQWHFFFLGAAFMLMEVQNVSKASVALGNTWLVNAVIISGILALVLLANAIAALWPGLPLPPVYALLVASCVGLYFFDVAELAALPFAARALAVAGLTCLPMLFSGLVFIRSFAAAPSKGRALAANMLGALAGGLLQSVTFLTGIQALLLLVACLYAAAVLTRPREETPGLASVAA